jgi:hypothetical protein
VTSSNATSMPKCPGSNAGECGRYGTKSIISSSKAQRSPKNLMS